MEILRFPLPRSSFFTYLYFARWRGDTHTTWSARWFTMSDREVKQLQTRWLCGCPKLNFSGTYHITFGTKDMISPWLECSFLFGWWTLLLVFRCQYVHWIAHNRPTRPCWTNLSMFQVWIRPMRGTSCYNCHGNFKRDVKNWIRLFYTNLATNYLNIFHISLDSVVTGPVLPLTPSQQLSLLPPLYVSSHTLLLAA